ncbi:hypothetical protein N9J07_01475 [Bacteroidia bacterium]|jgi:hypothetical protein|nr:hypothetical protein [Bacteroidia bacterium]
MAKIYTVLFVLFSISGFAQNEASISHYQRSWATDSIHLPCEKWKLKDLDIHIPDSLYNSGVVSIKKMRYQGVKGFAYNVTISEGLVSAVVLSTKGKKGRVQLEHLQAILTSGTSTEAACRPTPTLTNWKRGAILTITSGN